MDKTRRNQFITFIISIIGIILLVLGYPESPWLILLSVIVLVSGFGFMILISHSILNKQ